MSDWQTLQKQHAGLADRKIMDLFQKTDRAEDFSTSFADMHFDYSKTNIDRETRASLLELAENAGLADAREAMFSGVAINETEGRSVLHTALRNPTKSVIVDGEDISIGIAETLSRMRAFADQVRGSTITDVVNIGIGGSDLGPAMAYIALSPFRDGPTCHFVSNVDGAHVADTISTLNPKTTLLIVASKTFTTIETMTNAQTAKDWLIAGGGDPGLQIAALSSSLEKTGAWGIPSKQVFGFEDWVGGRYSVWGPIGLSLMLAIGPDDFDAFLTGAAEMDDHFRMAELGENLPVLLALVGIWHHQICGYPTRAVLPYDQRLSRLPAYLQQLEMESNGKGVGMDGADLVVASGPVVWGEPGTNGQHAFYQLIHQGTGVVPCEFMVAANGHEETLEHQHNLLIANCLAQSEALMKGRSLDEATQRMEAVGFVGEEPDRQARHRVFKGNRPSTTLIYPKLTPRVLGQIIALYEHRVFVEGIILGLNSFDQWGVELGKELATALGPIVEGKEPATEKDGSTQALVARLRSMRS